MYPYPWYQNVTDPQHCKLVKESINNPKNKQQYLKSPKPFVFFRQRGGRGLFLRLALLPRGFLRYRDFRLHRLAAYRLHRLWLLDCGRGYAWLLLRLANKDVYYHTLHVRNPEPVPYYGTYIIGEPTYPVPVFPTGFESSAF
jgi:hypothetical protein